MYYAALEASCELAKEQGPYESYDGSPVSKGVSFFFFFNDLDVFCHFVLSFNSFQYFVFRNFQLLSVSISIDL